MAFVPQVDMFVWFDKRPGTSAVVKAVDLLANLMWIRPIDGGLSRTAEITDHWSEVERHVEITEAWWLHGAVGSGIGVWGTRPYFTRAGALNAVDGTTVAMLHVNKDGTTNTEWFI